MELEIIKWGAYILVGIMGWLLRVVWTSMEEMKKDFNELERELPIHYVRKDEFKEYVRDIKESFRETINPVLSKLDRIEERMEEQNKENDRVYQRKTNRQ